MKSIKEIYKVGPGPSSSHTLAVQRACLLYLEHYPQARSFKVDLFDSLALTAEGHHTMDIIKKCYPDMDVEISKNGKWRHPYATALDIQGFDKQNNPFEKWEVASIGGGSIRIIGNDFGFEDDLYPHTTFDEVKAYVEEKQITLYEYVLHHEDNIIPYMSDIIDQMLDTVKTGLDRDGLLPGRLKVKRVAKDLLLKSEKIEDEQEKKQVALMAYAYAASEQNASGGQCVTAPTLGASGVLASLVYYYYYHENYCKQQLIEALCVGGIFANIIKENATLAGSEGGCQAEVGSAVAMGSAFIAYLNNASTETIEYAAEIGIEHHLGLTCDPVGGYVIIPCIERNGLGVLRCFDSALLANRLSDVRKNKVTFDSVVRTMNYTGKMIIPELRETSLGGLATEVIFDSED